MQPFQFSERTVLRSLTFRTCRQAVAAHLTGMLELTRLEEVLGCRLAIGAHHGLYFAIDDHFVHLVRACNLDRLTLATHNGLIFGSARLFRFRAHTLAASHQKRNARQQARQRAPSRIVHTVRPSFEGP